MSQCRELQRAGFPQFQLLPPELQLMVWEEVVSAIEKPRVVLLDVEECPDFQIAEYSEDLDVWRIRVDNSEELFAESHLAAALNLSGVCSTSRYVATRTLDQIHIVNPPQYCLAFEDLGLSLSSDVFWIPDNLLRFMQARQDPSVILEAADEHDINQLMISLDSLEKLVHWATGHWELYEDTNEDMHMLSLFLEELFDSFRSAHALIVMVDVPRGHVSWDQIQVAGLHEDNVPDRCHSVFQLYEARYDDFTERWASVAEEHGLKPPDASARAWPELSSAFRKSA